jgi:hypothetical protein
LAHWQGSPSSVPFKVVEIGLTRPLETALPADCAQTSKIAARGADGQIARMSEIAAPIEDEACR